MLHLRYSAGYWICFDFRICPNCQYTRVLKMSGLRKVLNKLFHDRCLTVLWICLGFWICQGFKYARVMNEISQNRYLTWFWICLEFWLWQFYTGFCRKRSIVHVWQSFEYCSGSQCARSWICIGCEYCKVTHGSL